MRDGDRFTMDEAVIKALGEQRDGVSMILLPPAFEELIVLVDERLDLLQLLLARPRR